MAVRRYDGPPRAAVGSPAEPAGAWLFDCPALPPKRRGMQQVKRADGFLWAPCRYSDQGALLFVMMQPDL